MNAFVSETFSDGVWSSTYTHTSSVQEFIQNITKEEFPILLSLAANAILNIKLSAGSSDLSKIVACETNGKVFTSP